ncbi:HNH endonuclease [Hydrogenophaga borbori]
MAKKLQRSRLLAYQSQAGLCFYCGLRMWLHDQGGPSQLQCTAEHLVARSCGGTDASSNIVAACWHCNHTRHKRKHPPEPDVYRAEVRARVQRGRWLPHQAMAWAKGRSPLPIEDTPIPVQRAIWPPFS